jgi:hypothetical protein
VRAALEIVNKMQANGVITDFAIGGAVGACSLVTVSTQNGKHSSDGI